MTLGKEPTEGISESLYTLVVASGLGREPPTPNLFHYTSSSGLVGIVSSGRIYATDVRFFNDTSEYKFGLDLIRGPMSALDSAGLAAVRVHIEEKFAKQHDYEIFVSCFCEADDLVPQWRGYGADGAGYAVGFPKSSLSREGKALLVGVLYGKEAVVDAANKAVSKAMEMLKKDQGDGNTAEKRKEDVVTSLMVTLFLIIVAGKDEVFAFEREFRLIHPILRSTLKTTNPIEFRSRNGVVVPFVTLPLPTGADGKLLVSSIRCGPSLSDASTEAGVRLLLEKHGLGEVLIQRSRAPLRPTSGGSTA